MSKMTVFDKREDGFQGNTLPRGQNEPLNGSGHIEVPAFVKETTLTAPQRIHINPHSGKSTITGSVNKAFMLGRTDHTNA